MEITGLYNSILGVGGATSGGFWCLRQPARPLPPPGQNLLEYSMLKSAAEPFWVQSIERKDGAIHIQFHPNTPVESSRLMKFIAEHPGVQFTPGGLLRIPWRDPAQALISQVRAVLQRPHNTAR